MGTRHEPRGVAKATGRVTALAFDADGKWLAVAGGEPSRKGVVWLFRVRDLTGASAPMDAQPVATIEAHKDLIYALAFSPDGKTLATAGYDRLIHLWIMPDDGRIATGSRASL